MEHIWKEVNNFVQEVNWAGLEPQGQIVLELSEDVSGEEDRVADSLLEALGNFYPGAEFTTDLPAFRSRRLVVNRVS